VRRWHRLRVRRADQAFNPAKRTRFANAATIHRFEVSLEGGLSRLIRRLIVVLRHVRFPRTRSSAAFSAAARRVTGGNAGSSGNQLLVRTCVPKDVRLVELEHAQKV
jgi:hypothetical protein